MEELDKFENPASRMLGFDLDSYEVQRALKAQNVCPIGQKNKKGKCKKDKQASKQLKKMLKKTAFFGGEVVSKEDLPKCYGKSEGCNGSCVPQEDCEPSRQYFCEEKSCGGDGCVCKIQLVPEVPTIDGGLLPEVPTIDGSLRGPVIGDGGE